MSLAHDMRDWLDGYPFEVRRPEEVVAFFREKGFSLERLKTCGRRHPCNEFDLSRSASAVSVEGTAV
jgi:hypothetical protein